ncbi:MAG TPA: hypothetical protein DIS78_05650 [Lachnospiraceae bacterium]|nr:hypothetical protein [Lachnospiraceae bacterium]
MSTRKKNGQNMLQWLIPTAILVIIILFTLITYKSDILTKEKNKKLDEYSNKAREMADYYSSEIYMISQIARMLSTRVSADLDYFCDDNVDLLTSAVTQLNIDAGYVLRNDGKVMNNKGVEAPDLASATDGDLSNDPDSTDEYLVNSSGDCVHYVSASYAEGKVILKYSPKEISDLELFLSSNAKTSTYLLLGSSGIILDSAGIDAKSFKEGSNLFEYLEGATYTGMTRKNEFIKNLEQQNKGKLLITNREGVPKYLVYQPIGDYKTFIMIVVDEAQIIQSAKKESASTTQMFWRIVILILVFVAILVVISIMNAANYRKSNRELREQAETDLLTDLYNKVATETKIKEYLANEGKNKKSIMFVLDIDNFKKINDTMGHAFGDEVLSTLGHQLKSEFRINDIIGRTGGDEFIIFLKDLKDDAALKRESERVATFFKNFKVGEYTKYSATASIGAVEIPNDGTEFETLYKSADKALYLAKKRGKNQMAFYKDTKDIKIEPEKPVLKVAEEAVKMEIKPEEKTQIDQKASEVVNPVVKTVEKLDVKEETNSVIKEAVKEEAKSKSEVKEEIKKKEPLPTIKEVFIEKNEEETKPVKVQQKTVKKVVKRVVKKPAEIKTVAAEPERSVKEQTVKAKPEEVPVDIDKKDVFENKKEEKPPVKKVVKKVVKKQVVSSKSQVKEDAKKEPGEKASPEPKAEEKPKTASQENEKFSFFT